MKWNHGNNPIGWHIPRGNGDNIFQNKPVQIMSYNGSRIDDNSSWQGLACVIGSCYRDNLGRKFPFPSHIKENNNSPSNNRNLKREIEKNNPLLRKKNFKLKKNLGLVWISKWKEEEKIKNEFQHSPWLPCWMTGSEIFIEASRFFGVDWPIRAVRLSRNVFTIRKKQPLCCSRLNASSPCTI